MTAIDTRLLTLSSAIYPLTQPDFTESLIYGISAVTADPNASDSAECAEVLPQIQPSIISRIIFFVGFSSFHIFLIRRDWPDRRCREVANERCAIAFIHAAVVVMKGTKNLRTPKGER